MGSAPSLATTVARDGRSKTSVQQICIDQRDGRMHERNMNNARKQSTSTAMFQRRFSSAVDSVSDKLRRRTSSTSKCTRTEFGGSAETRAHLRVLQIQLEDSERVRAELAVKVRSLERELHSLGRECAEKTQQIAWLRTQICGLVRNEVPPNTTTNGSKSENEWRERVLAVEIARRETLEAAIVAEFGERKLAELLDGKSEQRRRSSASSVRAAIRSKEANNAQQPENPSNNDFASDSDVMPILDAFPVREVFFGAPKTPADAIAKGVLESRLSTDSSTTPDGTEHQDYNSKSRRRPSAFFRPALNSRRHTTGGKSSKTATVDLDGICLDEEWKNVTHGAVKIEHTTKEPRRISTSAKSRDSGISD